MKRLLGLHLFIMTLGFSGLYLGGLTQGAISFSVGSGVIFLDLAILGWCWRNILHKKLIALAILVIVLKYAFLVSVIDWALTDAGLSAGWFCVGLATILTTVLAQAILAWQLKEKGRVELK